MGSITHTVEGSIASFVSPAKAGILSLKCYFKPVQEGTGDANSSNVREILGWNYLKAYISNKNLLDITKISSLDSSSKTINDGVISIPEIASSARSHIWFSQVFPAGTYTISALTTGAVGSCLFLCDTTFGNADYNTYYGGYRKSLGSTSHSLTVTIDTSFRCGLVFPNKSGEAGNPATIYDIQLELGSTKTDYKPYNGNIIPITFPAVGKNKFDPACDMLKNASAYTISGNQITQTGSDGRGWTDSNFKPIHLLAGTYRLTCSDGNNFNLRTSIDDYTSNKLFTNGGGTFTLMEECDVKFKHSASSYPTIFTILLELGDIATTYEPYSSNNTVYGGYVDLITGDIMQEYNIITLNGTENNWGAYGAIERNDYCAVMEISNKKKGNQTSICNKLKNVNSAYASYNYNAGLYCDHASNHNLYICMPNDITTLSDFKVWLSENPIQICYQLETPILVAKLSPNELQTLIGRNNIWSNTNDITSVTYDIHETGRMIEEKKNIIRNTPHIVTANGNIANFLTDMIAPIKSAKFYFNPVLEGSGDPSPENEREIGGWTGLNINKLPDEYLQVEYIETNYNSSTTTTGAYINTGIKPYLGLCSELVVKLKSSGYPLGSGGNNKDYYGWNGATNDPGRIIPYLGDGSYPSINGYILNTFRTLTIKGKKAYVDNLLIYDYANSTNSFSFSNARDLTLGAFNSSTITMSPIILKSAKFWDETTGNYIGYFIPCYRKSDNMTGLYDIITNTFFIYTGNKEFIAGPNISNYGSSTIDWTSNETIYGGYVDLISGDIYKIWEKVILTEQMNSWGAWGTKLAYNSSYMWSGTATYTHGTREAGSIIYSNILTPVGGTVNPQLVTDISEIRYYGVDARYPLYLFMANPNELSINEWRTWFNETYPDAYIIYKLAIPKYITTLTPQQLLTLRGTNNIWSTANGQTEITYWTH